jgi:predicted ATPase/DNA-binding SARP family transcriptional activator
VDFSLLGPIEVRDGDRVRRLSGKQGALLARLLLSGGQVVSAERLVDDLWGDAPPESARKALDVFVWRLRKAVPSLLIEKVGHGYRLDLQPDDRVDVHEFERLVAAGRAAAAQGDSGSASRLLADAVACWRGSALADLEEQFARAAASRLEELRLTAVEARIDAELAHGRDGGLAAELEALVAEHPLRESLRALLMRALYRNGRQADALAAYQEARRTLIDELGIEPSPALQELERAVLRQDPSLERPTRARAYNLPFELTTFVGREQELERLGALLRDSPPRLLTLTGAGGVGKTRLAVRAARESAESFEDGVVLVELAPLAEPALVVRAIAHELGVIETGTRPLVESLITHLAAKETLLVLDNFEHVAGAALDVARLLAACRDLTVLVTSRVPLRIRGEREFAVPPLELPPPAAPAHELMAFAAVQLFDERARGIRSDFVISDENGSAVAALCARLDGLPLAIELAAARTRILSPEAMLPLLESRLDVLQDSGSDRPSRQRTLRDSIGWSHDLLGERDRTLFRRLAIFRGGCTLAAAAAVCQGDDVFASMTTLVEHGLVTSRWATEGEPRFEMLETIAEFARERLAASGELREVARRQAEYFASFAQEIAPKLLSEAPRTWLLRLDDERDNIRAALAQAVEHDEAGPALRILGSLSLWYWRSFAEGLEWTEQILMLPSAADATSTRARALLTGQTCAIGAGDLEAIQRFGGESVALSRELGNDKCLAFGLALLPRGWPFDPERAAEFGDEAILVAERTGDPWIVARMKTLRALSAMNFADGATATKLGGQAVAAFDELGDSWSRSMASVAYGFGLLQLGELDSARGALRDSLPALVEVGDLKMAIAGSIVLAMVERAAQDDESSARTFELALGLCADAGDQATAPLCLAGLAASTAASEPERAGRLLGAARALFDAGNTPQLPGFELYYEGTHEAVTAKLGEALEPLIAEGLDDAARGAALMPGYTGV